MPAEDKVFVVLSNRIHLSLKLLLSDIGALFKCVSLLRHANLACVFLHREGKKEKQQRTCAQIKSSVCSSRWLLLVMLQDNFFFSLFATLAVFRVAFNNK